jgi:hypothetical protein
MALTVTPIVVREGALAGDTAPLISTFPGRGLLDQVRFHALGESLATDPEERMETALAALARALENESRSALTSALPRALQSCHRELVKGNEPLTMAARVGVGLTCLALRDDEVYVARAGPGLVYVRDRHGVRHLPGPPEGAGSLGTAEGEVDIAMDRHPIGPGEALLAGGSALEAAVGYEGLQTVLAAAPKEAARKLALLMGDQSLYVALLVTPEGG